MNVNIGMNWARLLSFKRPGDTKTSEKIPQSGRSPFEQDYDRIIFSHPFRMLQDKTQVFPLSIQDFVHTRLTHSLEVASVGRSLGKLAGEEILRRNPEVKKRHITSSDIGAIVAAASLMHDLGNPPFGHAGESAISQFFQVSYFSKLIQNNVETKEWYDLTNFEGNAQGFRLVNKANYQGLRLTYATMGAFSKYPRESFISEVDTERKSQKKYGFFQSNKEIFGEMAGEMGLIKLGDAEDAAWCRHPLTLLVEAADDICYSIIDLEDGTNLGLVDFGVTMELLVQIIGNDFKPEKFEKIQSKKEKVSALRALAVKNLIMQCVEKFVEEEERILSGRFDRALTDEIPASEVLKKIEEISIEKIYRSRPVVEREVAGFEVLNGLLESFVPAILNYFSGDMPMTWQNRSLMRLLPDDVKYELENEETSLYEAMLVILDFITGLTDSNALALYRNIKGIALP